MRKVELSLAAERDLIRIYVDGIDQFGLAAAESYAERLAAKIAVVAEHPDFGSDCSAVKAGLRRYRSVSHAIYYRPTSGGILVLRILHGRMDPGRHIL